MARALATYAQACGVVSTSSQYLHSVHQSVLTPQIPSIRPLLLTPFPPFPLPSSARTSSSEPLLSKIAPFTSHPDTIRRGGALAAIKNIALDRACHAFLLAGEDDRVRLPPGVLGRVAGGVKRDAEGELRTESGGASTGKEREEVDEEEDEAEVDAQVGREEVVRGVDVLPAVLGPLMGGEEYDTEVSLPTLLPQIMGPLSPPRMLGPGAPDVSKTYNSSNWRKLPCALLQVRTECLCHTGHGQAPPNPTIPSPRKAARSRPRPTDDVRRSALAARY